MSELPEYMRNFIKSVPQDKTFVKQGRLRTGWSALEWREPQTKDDVSTLSRFRKMSGEDQLAFLTRKVWEFMSHNKGNTWKERLDNWIKELATPNRERGFWAKELRETVKNMKLDFLFSSDDPDHRQFMNEDLREFLNLNEEGTMDYSWECVHEEEGWNEETSLGAAYHQYEVEVPVPINNGLYNNAKFLNKDGREVIFNYKKKRVNTHIDRGTFNYAPFKIPEFLISKVQDDISKRLSNVSKSLSATSKYFDTISKYLDTCPEYDLHKLYDVELWKELMKKEYSERFHSGFDFDKDIHDPENKRYLRGYALAKNSELWHIYYIDR